MTLSIIMPVLNEIDLTKKIISDIQDTIKVDYELIVIDGGCTDETKEFVSQQPNIIYIENFNKGVNSSRNLGVEFAKGDYIMVINNDIRITEGLVEKLMAGLKICKIVGPLSTRGDNEWELPTYYPENNIVGRCYMFKSEDKSTLFPIDPRLVIWYGDNWLLKKAEELIGIEMKAIVHHYESRTIKSPDRIKQNEILITKDKLNWFLICEEKGRKTI